MRKTKLQRHSLILAIIFMTIGIACAWGLADLTYNSIEYVPGNTIRIFTNDSKLLGPKDPKLDWDYYNRFNYDVLKETVNC